jgi:hypothetical protein
MSLELNFILFIKPSGNELTEKVAKYLCTVNILGIAERGENTAHFVPVQVFPRG